MKAKAKKYFRGINFTLISVSTVPSGHNFSCSSEMLAATVTAQLLSNSLQVIALIRSGKTDPVQFKRVFKQSPFWFKKGRFASSFLLLGVGLV